jgi:ABC-type nitrate/sulfonate/bicarbonate transport system substrate-binding protein
MTQLTLALDWTPNINHIGFFIAQEKGFYKELDLEIKIVDPSADNYQTTPAKEVELGMADFALCPTESIISYRTKSQPFPMIAIAAILKEDLSAIVVKGNSSITSPKDLDGKRYSSYNARYEDEIVREMIKNDGGTGDFEIGYPDKLGIWETVLDGSFDATWVFMNWEGVAAQEMEVPLSYFKMADYQIPYSYSPVIAANENLMVTKKELYQKFLQATKRGYLYCRDNAPESIALFKKYVPETDAHIDLNKALEMSLDAFGTQDNWGVLEESVVSTFMDWIEDKNLETRPPEITSIYTNHLL